MLTFQHLDVYRASIHFFTLATHLAPDLPRGSSHLADQLRRAALSIPLNIAEGAGRVAAADKATMFAIARGSAMECAAILDAGLAVEAVDEQRYRRGMELLTRVVEMLTRMCR